VLWLSHSRAGENDRIQSDRLNRLIRSILKYLESYFKVVSYRLLSSQFPLPSTPIMTLDSSFPLTNSYPMVLVHIRTQLPHSSHSTRNQLPSSLFPFHYSSHSFGFFYLTISLIELLSSRGYIDGTSIPFDTTYYISIHLYILLSASFLPLTISHVVYLLPPRTDSHSIIYPDRL
jgi:hypothetical protein